MATYPTEYAHPEALVETDWLEKHLKDDGIRVIESNEDILLYDTGHIPGAVHIDWRADLQDPLIRDYISPEKFARLCSRHGITPDTICIFYGDKANWWACYALWAFRLFGHDKVKILNGGRDKWKAEGRRMTREIPKFAETNYPVPKQRFDKEIRNLFVEPLLRHRIICLCEFWNFPRHAAAFRFPFVPAAIEDFHFVVPEQTERPESVASPPVRLIAVKNTNSVRRDSVPAAKPGKFFR